MFIAPEQATVYRAGKRRFFSRRAAYANLARTKYRDKHKVERWCIDVEDHEDAVMLDEEMERVTKRFARLMAHYDRVEMRGKNG